MENVKLKLANEQRVVGVQLLLKNLGVEETSGETLLRVTSKNNADKFNSCLLVIPGIEGVANVSWQNIASNLNLPTFILQLTKSGEFTTVAQITNSVAEQIKSELFRKKEFFYLVGYSFGSFITLEIARALEEAGMKGHILLVDGAPNFLKQLSYGHIGMTQKISDDAIQMMLILAIINQIFADENPEEITASLAECQTWSDKIDRLVKCGIRSNIKYSEQYLRQMVQSFYNRLKIVFDFNTENVTKIQSSITLVRPTEVAVVDIDDDYELSKYTEGTINLKFIEGNHATMLDNVQLPEIINDADPNLESDRSFKAYVWSGKNT